MRWWIQRQKEEREAVEKARQDTEEAYQEVVLSRDKRAMMLARMEEECRRRLNEATATFNRALVHNILYLLLRSTRSDAKNTKEIAHPYNPLLFNKFKKLINL